MNDRQPHDFERDLRGTEGFAMPAAIFALVILGVLVVGGFFMARQESRIGIASERTARAFYAAETGVAEVVENWDAGTYVGLDQLESTAATVSGTDWSANVTKLSDLFYLVESQGLITEGAAHGDAERSVASLVKIRTLDLELDGALTTQNQLNFGGSALIKGADTNPDGSGKTRAIWGGDICSAYTLDDKAGLVIDSESNINWNGNEKKIRQEMNGDPIILEQATDFEALLEQWEDLTNAANLEYTSDLSGTDFAPSLTADNRCNLADRNNWGAPLDTSSPCFDYFPIIYLNNPGQEWTLNAKGAGQGILLVEGDLRVNGGFEFYGPVIIRGTLTTNGSGGHFWGGTIAENFENEDQKVLGDAELQYSSCALGRAILGSSFNRPNVISERSWVDMTGARGR
ncbi:MAG TPA: hypothetical protein VJ925_05670 [Longimicrobiales bacterium]|nr:hypothetical protein [Longimicrobiales bacterium]